MPTVSRSVDRVFQIMGLFGLHRRPLTATEIRELLSMPHSSAVSLLSRLVTLGYLEQNAETKRFFPSLQLSHLCESVPNGIALGSLPAKLVDAVYERTSQTTSLSRLSDLFTLPIYARAACYRGAHLVTPGCTNGLATQSVTGQTLLSLKTDADLKAFIQRAEFWAKRAKVTITQHAAQVMQNVASAREAGFLCAYDQLIAGIGAVSFPLPPPVCGEALVVTVAGPSEQIRRNAAHILAVLRDELDCRYSAAQLDVAVLEQAV